MKKTKIRAGEYRVGNYVVIREDYPSMDEWDHEAYDVTWGIIQGEFYDRVGGNVGLPDSIRETRTLREALGWIEEQG
jgi:hypothetical protein